MTKKLFPVKKYGYHFSVYINKKNVVAKLGSTVGIAKCNPVDKFNLKLGIRLACLRVVLAGHKRLERRANRIRLGVEQQIKLLLKEIDIRCEYAARCDPTAPIELPPPKKNDTYPGAST